MKKILTTIFAVVAILPIFTRCSSDGASDEPKNNEEQVEKKTVYNAVYVSSEDKMAFITLKSDGSVEYCLDKYTMGYGEYQIADNKLIIVNEYTGYSDELEITDTESDGIRLKGNVRRYNSTDFTIIDFIFNKSSEETVTSVVGEEWSDYGYLHGEKITVYYTFTSEHEGKSDSYGSVYGYRGSGTFHYVKRTLIDTDNDGNKRTRKIVYRHGDKSTKPDVSAMDEANSLDINF